MDNIKESDIKYFLKNANKKQKEKFNKLYGRVTKYKKQYGGAGAATGETKTIYILWVRHCESCANATSFLRRPTQRFFRQPLCTKSGINQCFNFVRNLKWAIRENSDLQNPLKFYSSFLPRAMLTAKIISYSYDSPQNNISNNNNISNINGEESHQISSVKEIIPLKYISEKTNRINRLTSNQSQSRTTLRYLTDYCEVINEQFPGRKINTSDIPDTVEYESGQWANFKTEVLHTLDDNCTNLIVSHGKFIREEILPEASKDVTESETKNLYAYLVKYTIINPGNVTQYVTQEYIETDLNDSQDIPAKFFKDPENITLLERKLTSCDYTYGTNIKPKEHQRHESHQSFYGINGFHTGR